MIKSDSKDERLWLINAELTPFNLINNEYDNFELREKIFEKTSGYSIEIYP